MNRKPVVALISILALAMSASAPAQAKRSTRKPAPKKVVKAPVVTNRAEVGLVGVKLFDTGASVIAKFGSPLDIQAVGGGGGAIGPTGGGGGPALAGGGGGGRPGGPSGGGGGGGRANDALSIRPGEFSFGDEMLRLQGPAKGGGGGQGGPPDVPSAAGAGGGGGGAAPGGGGGMAGGTDSDRINYTRWIYKRGGSRYGIVFDRHNRVVQIEAIGMNDPKVKTARGVGYGSSFGTLIQKYGAPDGYEISGNNLVVRYLVDKKVAFRLSRLGENKPHVVTGIVVAGGKM